MLCSSPPLHPPPSFSFSLSLSKRDRLTKDTERALIELCVETPITACRLVFAYWHCNGTHCPKHNIILHSKSRACQSYRANAAVCVVHMAQQPDICRCFCSNRDRLGFYAEIQIDFRLILVQCAVASSRVGHCILFRSVRSVLFRSLKGMFCFFF